MTEPHSWLTDRRAFEGCFIDEPSAVDPAADLGRGRARRRRLLIIRSSAVALVVFVAMSAGLVITRSLPGLSNLGGIAGQPTAVPATPTPGSRADTAPALTWDARHGYLDSQGQRLDVPSQSAFTKTRRNSWQLLREHLDPGFRHLAAYDSSFFTGGTVGTGEVVSAVTIGQKIGWTVEGDRGQGMVQLAVTRAAPGTTVSPGTGAVGLCAEAGARCRAATVADRQVYLAETDGGGFAMDYRQADGEIASIIVDPLFADNTATPVRSMKISPAAAVELLDDPELDVVG